MIKLIIYIVLTSTICFSCSYDVKREIKIYQTNYYNNEFVFYYDNKLHIWRLCTPYNINKESNDIDSTFFSSMTEIYSDYPDKKVKYDSIYIAINLEGLSSPNGINFIANVKNDQFLVDIYFPYSLKGTYKFKLSKDERVLFYYLLNNVSVSEFGNLYLNNDSSYISSSIYLKSFDEGKSKYTFGDIYNSTKDIRIFERFLEILIEEKIFDKEILKDTTGYKNLTIYKEFDSLAAIYVYTSVPFYLYFLEPPLPTENEKSEGLFN